MATLTVQTLDEAELDPTLDNADTGSGDLFANDGNTFCLLENPGASAATATFAKVVTNTKKPGIGKVTKSDLVVNIGAGEQRLVGPFPKAGYNNGSGQVAVSYGGAGAADVDIAAIKMILAQ